LIIGADGNFGRILSEQLGKSGKKVLGTTRRQGAISKSHIFLNLSNELTDWYPPAPVEVAFFCAAVTSLEQCRQNPEESRKINVRSTISLAKKLVDSGTFVIFPSTNLVFDGSLPYRQAEDPVSPQTEYGRQKAEVEAQLLLSLGNSVSIVRFTKILTSHTPIIKQWIQDLSKKTVIHPLSDMLLAPVSLAFAVEVLLKVAEIKPPGIIQVSGERDVTYAEIAYRIASFLGVSSDLVQPITSADAGLEREATPQHTTMDNTRLVFHLGISPPPVWDVIDEIVKP
jgi:dTDP-4-dehydrorhamnose reductase